MLERVVFGVFVLMIIGYTLVEFSRYQNSQTKLKDREKMPYPLRRLVLRVGTSTALVITVWIAVFLKPFYGGTETAVLAFAVSAGAMLLVLGLDLAATYVQYVGERKRREEEFVQEVANIVAESKRSKADF
jgi:hypothetical protein